MNKCINNAETGISLNAFSSVKIYLRR